MTEMAWTVSFVEITCCATILTSITWENTSISPGMDLVRDHRDLPWLDGQDYRTQ